MATEPDHGIIRESDSELLEDMIEDGFSTGTEIDKVPEDACHQGETILK